MSESDRDRWNAKYENVESSYVITPAEWLADSLSSAEVEQFSADTAPRALDLACGLGSNAIWLAQQGWDVDAVDISETGLRVARKTAERLTCSVNWIEGDLDGWQPPRAEYDLITVFRFLDRQSLPRIVEAALKPGGWLIYETFSRGQLTRPESHVRNPDFLLGTDELPGLFPFLEVMAHHEEVLKDCTVMRFLGHRIC